MPSSILNKQSGLTCRDMRTLSALGVTFGSEDGQALLYYGLEWRRREKMPGYLPRVVCLKYWHERSSPPRAPQKYDILYRQCVDDLYCCVTFTLLRRTRNNKVSCLKRVKCRCRISPGAAFTLVSYTISSSHHHDASSRTSIVNKLKCTQFEMLVFMNSWLLVCKGLTQPGFD